MTVSVVDSVQVRVHLYERSLRTNPVRRVCRAGGNDAGTEDDTRGALGNVTDSAPLLRRTETRVWGVSDPLGAAPGAKSGAGKWGSLTPGCLSAQLRQRRGTRIPAAQSAAGARPEAADWQEHGASCFLHKGKHARRFESETACDEGGNGAPEFRFPHAVPPFSSLDGSNQRGRRRLCDSPADGCYGRS